MALQIFGISYDSPRGHMKRRCAVWLFLAGVILAAAGCGGSETGLEHKPITVKGSDTMVILAQRWAERYMTAHPDVSIQVTGGGSGTGSECSSTLIALRLPRLGETDRKGPDHSEDRLTALDVAAG